ncbi:hypothetical protein [Natrinema salifodinae]|uniref:Uncharacterized protein n=1 Tax=Natrinema salifodinae TaxID=1202768 RepID=A0A1I0Q2N4_9EURY|nr:hypothetical protein [Natrinema salifodinae]SEW21113.1 hypothetical protein SAMN05216285_2983 [Natrinema salifodinae]
MATASGTADVRSEIATRLAVRLVLVVGAAAFCTWTLLPWDSVLAFPLVLVVDLIALWFAVHDVFAALDDLLEAKLERIEMRDGVEGR